MDRLLSYALPSSPDDLFLPVAPSDALLPTVLARALLPFFSFCELMDVRQVSQPWRHCAELLAIGLVDRRFAHALPYEPRTPSTSAGSY